MDAENKIAKSFNALIIFFKLFKDKASSLQCGHSF